MPGPADADRLLRVVREDPALAAYGGIVASGEWALDLDAELLSRLAGEGALYLAASPFAVSSSETPNPALEAT